MNNKHPNTTIKTIPLLTRELYLADKNGEHISSAFILNYKKQLKSFLLKSLPSFAKNKLDDIISDFYDVLFTSFKNSNLTFWESIVAETQENNNRIFGYLKTLLKEAERESSRGPQSNMRMMLYKAIARACKDLLIENQLVKSKQGKMELADKDAVRGKVHDIQLAAYVFWDNSGRIKSKKLKMFLLAIFFSENSPTSLSNITDKVLNESGLRTLMIYEKVVTVTNEDNNEVDYIDTISDNTEFIPDVSELKNRASEFIAAVRKEIKEAKFEKHAAVFYLYFHAEKTYEEIAQMMDGALSKSSTEKYFKDFIQALKIDKYYERDSPLIIPIMHQIAELLKNQYRFDEKYSV